MAMLNTDFATEPQTCGEDPSLPEELRGRRAKAGLASTAKQAVGLEWRSPDVSIVIISRDCLEYTHLRPVVRLLLALAVD
jgi:hypothetical protein